MCHRMLYAPLSKRCMTLRGTSEELPACAPWTAKSKSSWPWPSNTVTGGLLTQGVRTLDRVKALRQERQEQALALSSQEVAIGNADTTAVRLSLVGGTPAGRLAAQSVLAVMLEIVSIIALSLLCGNDAKSAKGGGASLGGPLARVVRLKVASTRIASDAGPCQSAPEVAPCSTNAHGHQTLLHRIGANATSHAMRITCGANLHRPVSRDADRDTGVGSRDAGWHCMGANAASQKTRIACDAASLAPTRRRHDAQRLHALYAQAKELVCTAQMPPRYREMQRALGASQQVVQRFLRDLVAEGVLCRQGTAYAVVSPMDTNGGAA